MLKVGCVTKLCSEASVKFLYSTHGFRAFLKTPQARYYIQPYANGIQDAYIVFDKKDEPIPTDINLTCGVSNSDEYQYARGFCSFEVFLKHSIL